MRSSSCLVALAVVGVACSPQPRQACQPQVAPAGQAIRQVVGDELLRRANHGREILTPSGFFKIPSGVRRVWIDVGAHHMETTRLELARYADVAVVAIEPLAECWPHWADSERVIGIPAAIYLERGAMTFHVNASDQASSLAESVTGAGFDGVTRTVEVRTVPVLPLQDILASIPQGIDVVYLKTDVQGVDLQVLQSAGEQLRRVYRVRAEVINANMYQAVKGSHVATEQEIVSYLAGKGFAFVADDDVREGRNWLDKVFVNIACRSWADRFWQHVRYAD